MKILLFGYGSITRKHLSVIGEVFDITHITLILSSKRDIFIQYPFEVIIRGEKLDNRSFDLGIITSTNNLHLKDLQTCAHLNIPQVYLEKPAINNFRELQELYRLKNSFRKFQIGYDWRYSDLIHHLRRFIRNSKEKPSLVKMSVESDVRQWRNNIEYLKSASCNLSLGADLLLDMSHEVDLALFLFGNLEVLSVNSFQTGVLELEISDYSRILMTGKNKTNPLIDLSISLSRSKDSRFIEVQYRDYFIHCDLIAMNITKVMNISEQVLLDSSESRIDRLKKAWLHFNESYGNESLETEELLINLKKDESSTYLR